MQGKAALRAGKDALGQDTIRIILNDLAERRWIEVEQVGVHPDYRRQGVARLLLNRILKEIDKTSKLPLELNTWSFNKAASIAFGQLGFIERNVRREWRESR